MLQVHVLNAILTFDNNFRFYFILKVKQATWTEIKTNFNGKMQQASFLFTLQDLQSKIIMH